MDKVKDERIWVSGMRDIEGREEGILEKVEYTVNVSLESYEHEQFRDHSMAHIPVFDGINPEGEKPSYRDFEIALDTAWNAYQKTEGDILIHCGVGISRSVSIAAAVIARANDEPYDEALEKVYEARGKGLKADETNQEYAKKWLKDNDGSFVDSVYEERNKWALGFVKAMDDLGQPAGYRVPEKEDDERLDDEDEQSEWVIIWAITPEGEEVSAHIPRELLPDSLEKSEGEYDGYEPDENYRRLRHYYG